MQIIFGLWIVHITLSRTITLKYSPRASSGCANSGKKILAAETSLVYILRRELTEAGSESDAYSVCCRLRGVLDVLSIF